MNFKRPTQTIASLDDLVDETVSRNSHNHDSGDDNDDIDPIDAYMAELTEQTNKSSQETANNKVLTETASEDEADADQISSAANLKKSTNKTIKRLNQLSQKQVSYIPFKKDFYVEVPDVARLSDAEVKEIRASLENITVVGKSCPKPALCWAHCGLNRKVMDILKKYKYHSPTPIQAQAIPAIMSGRDVIGIAKTGCGKTLSFLLPMFRHILDQPLLQKSDGPIAVVITPTRELATQICDDTNKFTKVLGIRAVAIYGGPNISEQIALLKPGAEIVVCTPGRMIEILTLNGGKVTNLNRCTFLVLDEADRLFDMGFEKQITSIVNLIRKDRQTVLFSATFPKIMEAHARRILQKPIEIQVGGRSVVCKDVHQTVQVINENDKFPRLIQILLKHVDDKSSAIVFVARQEKADNLLDSLMQSYDTECLVLHGGIDKDDRISTFASFKSGKKKVLVATSVAARGLDVKNCILVVNYDCPNHYEDYVHRCGRTGRAGNKGFAYTFITPDQAQYANSIIKALTASEFEVPEQLQKLWDDYKLEQERLGNKVWSSSGFSGKGFKFDDSEAKMLNEKNRYQKKSLGLQNSDDEDAEADSEGEELAQHNESDTNIDKIANSNKPQTVVKDVPDGLTGKIELVKRRAAEIFASKNINAFEVSLNIAASLSKLITEHNAETRNKLIAKSCVAATSGPGKPPVASIVPVATPDTTEPLQAIAIGDRFEMELEINNCDYSTRRRLTSKDTLNRISEVYETGITVRGTFCEPGKTTTERKLYLALESKFKLSVERAYLELQRIIKDEESRIKTEPLGRVGKFKLL